MKQDEIIEMARQSGLLDMDFEAGDWEIHEFTTFAKLVAAKEREACAKYVDHILKEGGGTWGDAIRARGEE